MISFIFEQYGYYPQNLQDNSFEIDEWQFKLIEIDYNDVLLKEIEGYLENINKSFPGNGVFIIKSRLGQRITSYDGKRYVLISVVKKTMSIKDLNKFHSILKADNMTINLLNLAKTWEERVEYIEKNAISSLRIDSVYYSNNLNNSMFLIGQTINAIQYLNDVVRDFKENLENVTLTHKRITDLNSFDFFNPFNYIVDHPIRDLIGIFKSGYLEFEDFLTLLEYYKLDSQTASYAMARVLYPSQALDALENNIKKNSSFFKINLSIEEEISKNKKIYQYLKNKFNIRPIIWLENSN